MEGPGCPLCKVGREQERRYFFWFFAENHHSPETLARLVDAYGFCPRHAHRLTAEGGAHAATLTSVYEFLARKIAGTLGAALERPPASWPERSLGRCPACASREGAEDRLLDPLAGILADEHARQRYRRPGLLCHTHLRRLEPRLGTESLLWVLQQHRSELDAVVKALQRPDRGTEGGAAIRRMVKDVDVPGVPPRHASHADAWGVRSAVERTLDDPSQCPVCVAEADMYRAWARSCEARASGSEPIDDLLPTCDEHVTAFLLHGTDHLGDRTLDNLASLLRAIVVRALGELESRPSRSGRERLRAAVTSGRGASAERRARSVLHLGPACPVCAMLDATQARAFELLALLVQTEPGRWRYGHGHGLCLRHLRTGLAGALDAVARRTLVDHARLDVELLAWDLQEAGRLDAWTARALPRGTGEESWKVAISRFVGSPDSAST